MYMLIARTYLLNYTYTSKLGWSLVIEVKKKIDKFILIGSKFC